MSTKLGEGFCLGVLLCLSAAVTSFTFYRVNEIVGGDEAGAIMIGLFFSILFWTTTGVLALHAFADE